MLEALFVVTTPLGFIFITNGGRMQAAKHRTALQEAALAAHWEVSQVKVFCTMSHPWEATGASTSNRSDRQSKSQVTFKRDCLIDPV